MDRRGIGAVEVMRAVDLDDVELDKYTEDVLSGSYDTDGGGRNPEFRAQLRRALRELAKLDKLDYRACSHLPMRDMIMAIGVASSLLFSLAKYIDVRQAQSYSMRKRVSGRGWNRDVDTGHNPSDEE